MARLVNLNPILAKLEMGEDNFAYLWKQVKDPQRQPLYRGSNLERVEPFMSLNFLNEARSCAYITSASPCQYS